MVEIISWISGHAIRRLLDYGPTAKFYMGLKNKPGIIYDVAYSADETIKIGLTVARAMKIPSTNITTGELSENTAASLYYIVNKHYPKPEMSQIYRISIGGESAETFSQWCIRVKGKDPYTVKAYQKIEWYMEWKQAGH